MKSLEGGCPYVIQPPPEGQGLDLGCFVEIGLTDVIAPVGRLEQALVVVPLRPVAALLARFGQPLDFLVMTNNETEWHCVQGVSRGTIVDEEEERERDIERERNRGNELTSECVGARFHQLLGRH